MPRHRSALRNLAYLARHNRIVEWTTFVVWAVRRSGAFSGKRARFISRELWGERNALHEYRLRGESLRALIRHRSRDAAVVEEVFIRDFYRPPGQAFELIGGAPVVVGLGGHIGLFGLRVRALWPEARVTEFEPDSSSAAILRRTIDLNELADTWNVVEAYAASREGTTRFAVGQSSIARAAGRDAPEGDAVSVPSVDVFPHLRTADLIKMDIEGGEWEILCDERFADLDARAIVLEHHPQHCPAESPQGFARELLERAGYTVRPIWCKPNEVGMMWAWKA